MEYSLCEAVTVKEKGIYLKRHGVNIIPILKIQKLDADDEGIPREQRYYDRVIVLEEPFADGKPLTTSSKKEDLLKKWKMVSELRPEVIQKAFKDIREIIGINLALDTCPAENIVVSSDAIQFIDVHDGKYGKPIMLEHYFSTTAIGAYKKIFAHLVGTGGARSNNKYLQGINKESIDCSPEMVEGQNAAIENVCLALEGFNFKKDAKEFDNYLRDNGIVSIEDRKNQRDGFLVTEEIKGNLLFIPDIRPTDAPRQ